MKIGFSMLLQSYPDAKTLDYGDCAVFQVVCPICFEAVFKCVRRAAAAGSEGVQPDISAAEESAALTHYLSHYTKTEQSHECELRVSAMSPQTIFEKNQVARDQNLRYFISVLKNAVLQSFSDCLSSASVTYNPRGVKGDSLETARFRAHQVEINQVRRQRLAGKIEEVKKRLDYLETTFDDPEKIRAAAARRKKLSPAMIDEPQECRDWIKSLEFHERVLARYEEILRFLTEVNASSDDGMAEYYAKMRRKYFAIRKLLPFKKIAGSVADQFARYAAEALDSGTQSWREWVKGNIEFIEKRPDAPLNPIERSLAEEKDLTEMVRESLLQAELNGVGAGEDFEDDDEDGGDFDPLDFENGIAEALDDFEDADFDPDRFFRNTLIEGGKYGEMIDIEHLAKTFADAREEDRVFLLLDKLLDMEGEEFRAGDNPYYLKALESASRVETLDRSFTLSTIADVLAHIIDTSTGYENREAIFMQAILLTEEELTFIEIQYGEAVKRGNLAETQSGMMRTPPHYAIGTVTEFEQRVCERIRHNFNRILPAYMPKPDAEFFRDLSEMTPPESWENDPETPAIGQRHFFGGRRAADGLEMFIFAIFRNVLRILARIDYAELLRRQRAEKSAPTTGKKEKSGKKNRHKKLRRH